MKEEMYRIIDELERQQILSRANNDPLNHKEWEGHVGCLLTREETAFCIAALKNEIARREKQQAK